MPVTMLGAGDTRKKKTLHSFEELLAYQGNRYVYRLFELFFGLMELFVQNFSLCS